MPIINGMSIVMGADDPGYEPGRVWTGSRRVDMRARPGRRTDLPDGVFASRLASGLQTSSCVECRQMLARFASPAAALAKGFQCGGPQGNELLDYCWGQATKSKRA